MLDKTSNRSFLFIKYPASLRLKQWDFDSPQLVGLRQSFASNWHTTSVLDLRSPNNTGHLFLLFFFQFFPLSPISVSPCLKMMVTKVLDEGKGGIARLLHSIRRLP
jgi:hypothetical protein